MNRKLFANVIMPAPFNNSGGAIGYNMAMDETLTGKNFVLPMIVEVDITVKFIESKSTVYDSTFEYGNTLYDYITPTAPTT